MKKYFTIFLFFAFPVTKTLANTDTLKFPELSADNSFNTMINYHHHHHHKNDNIWKPSLDMDILGLYFINIQKINVANSLYDRGRLYWTTGFLSFGFYQPLVFVNSKSQWSVGLFVKPGYAVRLSALDWLEIIAQGLAGSHGHYESTGPTYGIFQLPLCVATYSKTDKMMIGGGVSYNYYDFDEFGIPKLRYKIPPVYFFVQKHFRRSHSPFEDNGTGFRLSVIQNLSHDNNNGIIVKKGWEFSGTLVIAF